MEGGLLARARLLSANELAAYADRDIVAGLLGAVSVAGRDVSIMVGLPRHFPLRLPAVFLLPWDALGIMPHIEQDGYICYADNEGLILDSSDPVGILEEALHRAIRLLELGFSGNNRMDFMDEFLAYWTRLDPEDSLLSVLEPSEYVHEVEIYRNRRQDLWVADNSAQLVSYLGGRRKALETLTLRKGLYIPLKPGSFVAPPLPNQPWSLQDVQDIINRNITEENRKLLQRFTQRKAKWEEIVVLALPRPSGGLHFIGLRFRNVRGSHPLSDKSTSEPPRPLMIWRRDWRYLAPRGGTLEGLDKWNVLLVGVGSVGGFLAMGLVQNGLRHLTIVDPDVFMAENTFRHVLGQAYIGQAKVQALKTEIERKYPYMVVTPCQATIEDAVTSGSIKLADYDLCIFVTGNHTVELYMNELVRKANGKAIFAWVEPYGLGGHALLMQPSAQGCLRCLYTPIDETDSPLLNRASFAAPGQHFAKDDLRWTPLSRHDFGLG